MVDEVSPMEEQPVILTKIMFSCEKMIAFETDVTDIT